MNTRPRMVLLKPCYAALRREFVESKRACDILVFMSTDDLTPEWRLSYKIK